MIGTRTQMRQNVFDATNGTIAVSYVAVTINGWGVSEWAALAALIYSCILIIDKVVGMVPRYRPPIMAALSWVWSKVARRG
jgi:hypothetical protein